MTRVLCRTLCHLEHNSCFTTVIKVFDNFKPRWEKSVQKRTSKRSRLLHDYFGASLTQRSGDGPTRKAAIDPTPAWRVSLPDRQAAVASWGSQSLDAAIGRCWQPNAETGFPKASTLSSWGVRGVTSAMRRGSDVGLVAPSRCRREREGGRKTPLLSFSSLTSNLLQ